MFKTQFKNGMAFGLGVSLCVLMVSSLAWLFAQVPHGFTGGTVVSAGQLNENFNNLDGRITALDASVTKIAPIGTILAWDKNLGSVPGLPDGWVQCDGQTLSDPDSPLNGSIIPNLNAARNAWNSKGSFLRGGTTSGVFEDDAFQGHYHNFVKALSVIEWYVIPGPGVRVTDPGNDVGLAGTATTQYSVTNPITDGSNGAPRSGGETRSVNMSVVWIMRVK